MKVLDRPQMPIHLQESFTRNKAIRDAIEERIVALETNATPPELTGFTRWQKRFIKSMAAKRLLTPELQRTYIEAIDATRQLFKRPIVTDLEFDVFAALDQPEMLEAFGQWEYPRGSRGFEANPTCAKALMTLVALGNSPHVRSVRKNFITQSGLQEVFAHLEDKWAALAGRDAKPCKPKEYTVCLDHIDALSSTGFDMTLLKANVEIHKALRHLHPDGGGCEWATIDGTDVAAWCEQISDNSSSTTADEELDAVEDPDEVTQAGARYYGSRVSQVTGDDGNVTTVVEGHEKFWKGYYLVVLTCVKTGLPIVWTLRNAALPEVDATQKLLELLYELWPDCPLKVMIGDKAWDHSDLAEMTLVKYGVHLISLQNDQQKVADRVLTIDQHKNIGGYKGDGTVVCRHHGTFMSFKGSEFGKRDGLKPGEASKLADFRLRFHCQDCGKSYSISPKGFGPSSDDWNILTHYPRNPLGQPKRYAERRAMETRRNSAEMTFSSLKTICHLALRGPSRTRLTNFDTIATLISLSFSVRNAQALAGERIKRQQYPSNFPAALLGGRAMYAN